MWLGKISALLLLIWLSPIFGLYQRDEAPSPNLRNQTFQARVIRIIDGDTMEVLYKNSPIKIRLAHIDCPEKRAKQPFGNQAKKALSDLCFGQTVTLIAEKYDRYKRLIALVINVKKQVVNEEMIKLGMAWHFKKYSKDPVYARLEIDARKNKTGLWADPNPTAPWDWRKIKSPSFKNSFH